MSNPFNEEVVMSVKSFLLLSIILCSLVLAVAFSAVCHAESISPAQEQEYADAKAAVEDARRQQAEKLASAPLKQAQEHLKTAAAARQSLFFSRASPSGPYLRGTGESPVGICCWSGKSGILLSCRVDNICNVSAGPRTSFQWRPKGWC